ncbi:endonuclease/exonuclease/phosphatase family protein [Piscinibacter defluvii]|uniref:endonuclease/exonuclease/phosphatase family protein n=1 Tax=Piscinibacter defluvii TaxID=1796922 RepID=UPI000FDEFC77|nr:endonuclease/exonuclease/phosphatase family protein [Piscinibacter defluvii]
MKLRTLSIATFNLYNFNEPGLRLYGDRDGWSAEQHALKTAWTARMLRLLESDLVGFQELWHAASLARAVQQAGLEATHELIVPPGTDGRRIVCAALLRRGLRVGEPEWIADFPPALRLAAGGDDAQSPEIAVSIDGFSRPVLHLRIQPRDDEPEVHVFVCHFKSKAPSKVYYEPWYRADPARYGKHANALGAALATIRRTAEAAALRVMLTELMKDNDTPVIVLGDINDAQLSNTANILTEQPRYLFSDATGGSDVALYTAQTLQEFRDTRDVYYTHVHEGVRESLDHILVSQEFYDHSRKRRWLFDGMTVDNDHLNREDHEAEGSNDHGLIRAVFRYRPAGG